MRSVRSRNPRHKLSNSLAFYNRAMNRVAYTTLALIFLDFNAWMVNLNALCIAAIIEKSRDQKAIPSSATICPDAFTVAS